MEPCVYREPTTNRRISDLEVHPCKVFGECVEKQVDARIVNCDGCKSRLALDDPNFKEKWLDPLEVFDRERQPTHALRNLLVGESAFLVCGGPSATEDKIEALSHRGHFSLAVNNKAGHTAYRPQAFVFSDTASKFSHSIWYDPAIMKFCPTPKLGGSRASLLRKDTITKEFLSCGKILDCPNVWAFSRRSWLQPDDTFFTENSAAWGNLKVGVERTGLHKTVCTMLLGLRILYYLGARRIFLVGVDFNMTPGNEYSFKQGKESSGASLSNNAQYRVVGDWLFTMYQREVFRKFGLEIYNTNPTSGLRAFPHLPFETALELSRGFVEDVPDLSHWYEKIDEQRMRQIEKLIVSGLSIEQICDKMNQGVNARKVVSEETIKTYLRILYERRIG